jgi:hypothetical protein
MNQAKAHLNACSKLFIVSRIHWNVKTKTVQKSSTLESFSLHLFLCIKIARRFSFAVKSFDEKFINFISFFVYF